MAFTIAADSCRVCLVEQEIMINLFDTVEDFQRQRLSDLLESCTDLKIDKTDDQPKLICEECTGELLVAAKFHEKCKRTVEILSHLQYSVESDEKDDDQNPDLTDSEKNLIEMDDPDGIIIEEEELDKGECIEAESTEHMDGELMFEEVGYVEDDANNDQIILFDPEGIDKNMPSEHFIKKEDDLEEIDQSDDGVCPMDRKKSNRTTVIPRPLVINCICDVCGAGFTHINNLTRHIHTHSPNEIYMCAICKHPFTTSSALETHKVQHRKDPELIKKGLIEEDSEETNLIEKVTLTETKGIMRGETETLEESRKSKICDICNKPFVSKSALEAHVRTHTGDRPFKCHLCSKAFKTHGGLVLHLRRHSGIRPFNCYVCNKGFGESSNLRVHMRTHTGEKPHKCTICDRSFTRVFLLQIHLRTHTGERPYQCPYCDRAFTQGGDLASHKRTHTGERPHVCRFCNKGFIKSSGLTQHMRKHTNHEMKSKDPSQKSLDKKEHKNYDFRLLMVKDDLNESDDTDYKDKMDDYVIDFPQDIET